MKRGGRGGKFVAHERGAFGFRGIAIERSDKARSDNPFPLSLNLTDLLRAAKIGLGAERESVRRQIQ